MSLEVHVVERGDDEVGVRGERLRVVAGDAERPASLER
jgi:hypothetical protein